MYNLSISILQTLYVKLMSCNSLHKLIYVTLCHLTMRCYDMTELAVKGFVLVVTLCRHIKDRISLLHISLPRIDMNYTLC